VRPELKHKLTPDYNLGCTRIRKSDKNYYAAVQLPNAHIVKGQIARIVPDGVVVADGTQVKLDAPGARMKIGVPVSSRTASAVVAMAGLA
jgi:cation diffusion facilitator CzcD-associated flavoprotein CzcO